ncbi:MAG TPA: malonic semialdehyde reductase [Steroidobacteraceae bacterium]|jgi:nitroreductase
MSSRLSDPALDQLFRIARTRNGWSDRAVPEALVRDLYELLRLGPTSANSCPARFVWVSSPEGKQRLAALASESNGPKILEAPLTVIVGYDLAFAALLPQLFPSKGDAMKALFQSDAALAHSTAFRNGSLQGGYLILAARALGLDCGPMSGFNNAAVDAAFFAGSDVKSNFLCSIGYGNDRNLYPRNPRLSFDEAGRFA